MFENRQGVCRSKLQVSGMIILLIGVLVGGCFTPQLLNTPYQEPLESQRAFSDEFDNPVHLGNRWRPVSGWWRIKEGQLWQSLKWRSSLPGEFQMAYVYGLASGPYEVETRLNFLKDREQSAGILLRFQDQNNFYLLRMRHYPRWQDYIDLTQYVSGVRREDLQRVNLTVKPGDWYNLRAEDRGTEIVAFLDGKELFRHPTRDHAVGTVGLAVRTGQVNFDYFSASYYEGGAGKSSPPPEMVDSTQPNIRRPYFSTAATADIPDTRTERFDPDNGRP